MRANSLSTVWATTDSFPCTLPWIAALALHQDQLHFGAMKRRRWPLAACIVEPSDLTCPAKEPHRSCTAMILFACDGPLVRSAWQEGNARVQIVSHTLSPAQESRTVHSTDRISHAQHRGTSTSRCAGPFLHPVSPSLRRLQSLRTQSDPTAVTGLQLPSPGYQSRSVVSADQVCRIL